MECLFGMNKMQTYFCAHDYNEAYKTHKETFLTEGLQCYCM